MVCAVSDLCALSLVVIAKSKGLRSCEIDESVNRTTNRLRERLEILRRDPRRESRDAGHTGGHYQSGRAERSREDDFDESDDGAAAADARPRDGSRHTDRPARSLIQEGRLLLAIRFLPPRINRPRIHSIFSDGFRFHQEGSG